MILAWRGSSVAKYVHEADRWVGLHGVCCNVRVALLWLARDVYEEVKKCGKSIVVTDSERRQCWFLVYLSKNLIQKLSREAHQVDLQCRNCNIQT